MSDDGDESAERSPISETPVPYETRVPSSESPVECPYCERPLESEKLLILHEGLDHWERLSDEEREAFREAYRDENADLRTFRLKMLGLLVLLYFAFLFVYSYFTSDPYSVGFVVEAAPTIG
jgi:hypothetical protein